MKRTITAAIWGVMMVAVAHALISSARPRGNARTSRAWAALSIFPT